MKNWYKVFFVAIICLTFGNFIQAAKKQQSLTLIYNAPEKSSPVNFGINELLKALDFKGVETQSNSRLPKKLKNDFIIIGTSNEKHLYELAKKHSIELPDSPEALLVKRIELNKSNALLVCGGDERGLMYALLELAKQVENLPGDANFVEKLQEISEKPFATERSLSTYVRTEHVMQGYWHNNDYWNQLFEQLAYSRINYYDIIFKVRPPIYTLFFDVDGFNREEVGGTLISEEEQAKNLASLKYIVKTAHEHGVLLTLGIWNHVHNPEDADRLAPYTEAAIAKLIKEVPFDAFQFRMHWESGLPKDPETLRRFWGSVFDGVKNAGRPMRIYPRAKGLPNLVIEVAVEKEMDFAIETKYMAEQMGMPFHPAHIQVQNQFDRRHGYADLLTYPKRYDILWRSWSWGSQKLLTWGSMD